ncbi:16S rRNA (uracil(1498)-N(3))-methyltransferase [Paeniglutamicibacter kerguelensis]|uniref:Ribosomal RNA small subunit methyltransferase E n=1 Tax=Paeniglutamicibacter kerguelensis TaxID=254788 RepID=A0ABS4XC42_9MICC|nr:16S rRNA (uracil(1498)-N(3))-methyltransferase [Paeniglutamicibacter kerguelensis]MBP2386053.1 16S rRNA (uracil1498-N3)-methyltransferase [Paeniglutamicibacter kerguelensis]
MSNQCFFMEPGSIGDPAVGSVLTLEGPEAHHAVNVKRVRGGETIDLVDGTGVRARVEVLDTDKSSLRATVASVEHEEAQPVRITLVQALAKGDRDLQAVESAVELGIDAVRPWQSERAIVRWNEAKAAKALGKWEATVLSALKQSRRTFLPEVLPMLSTPALAKSMAAAADAGTPVLVLVLHERGAASVADVVGTWAAEHARELAAGKAPRAEVHLVVGPEGGISDHEIDQFLAAGAKVALLGQHVLRASTAGPAALVLVRHLLGQL